MALIAHRPSPELVDLVASLGGTWHGYTATCRCPAHSDKTPSLSLRQGDRGILVTCFAGCDPNDVLRELGRLRPGATPAPLPRAPRGGTANIERLWNEAGPVEGSLGESYLAGRNLLPIPEDIRFHPRCPFGARPDTVFRPAILVAIREAQMLVAFQRIALDPATGGYIEKATLGTAGAGAWRGGGIGPTIGLAESFEDARAWSLIRGLPCWASFGTRRFDLLAIPDSVTELILAADDDPAGHTATRRAIRAYISDRRIVRVDLPKTHKDWAAVMEAQERGGGREG